MAKQALVLTKTALYIVVRGGVGEGRGLSILGKCLPIICFKTFSACSTRTDRTTLIVILFIEILKYSFFADDNLFKSIQTPLDVLSVFILILLVSLIGVGMELEY